MRFFEISEAGLRVQNPFSEEKLMRVGDVCGELGYLEPGTRLLDLACGQGEMMCRWAQRYGIAGTGVDINASFIDAARQRAGELGVASQVTFVQADGIEYLQGTHAYDTVSCIGGSWIGGSLAGTIHLVRGALEDEQRGLLLAGDLFWAVEPNQRAAEAMGIKLDDALTLPAIYDLLDEAGIALLYMVLSDVEGWDRYQTHHWVKIHQWLREHPDDPDAAEFAGLIEDWKRSYLTYRGHFGFGVFVLGVRE
jgi:SAM-dependent methyltransferase